MGTTSQGRAVLYCRFSCSKQNEKSIEDQRRECVEYCERKGYRIIDEYDDEALSGKTDNRPSFLRLIEDSARKRWDYVVVWKLDRFARNRYDSAIYKRKLKLNGVRVVSATEEIPDTPEGIMLETMMEGWAEYYSADLSQKMKRAIEGNLLKGRLSGTCPPFGYSYKDGKLFIKEEEARVIKGVFEDYANTAKTLAVIAEELNAKGVLTARGNKWETSSLGNLLRNKKYTGEYSLYGITRDDICPRIVDLALFNKVQLKLSLNRKGGRGRVRKGTDYLLFGKAYCGNCGSHMVGTSCLKPNGKAFKYYVCARRKKKQDDGMKSCGLPLADKGLVEGKIGECLFFVSKGKDFRQRVVEMMCRMQKAKDPLLEALERELDDNGKKISNLLDVISSGLTSEAVKGQLKDLEAKGKEISGRILEHRKRDDRFSRDDLVRLLEEGLDSKANAKEVCRVAVSCLVRQVVFNGDGSVDAFLFKPFEKNERLEFRRSIDLEETKARIEGACQVRGHKQEGQKEPPRCTKPTFYVLKGGGLMIRIWLKK